MEIKSLEGIAVTDILQVFNASFSDYIIPFELTETQLIAKMQADKTDLTLSVGVFESGRLIAFILHGLAILNNQQVVYNGGTGVIPEKRGFGLTKKMYSYILPILVEQGIAKIILEVITDNIAALTSYEQAGFSTKRVLSCYKGAVAIASTKHPNLKIKELADYNWETMVAFWDIRPSWQNAKHVLNTLKKENISLGAYNDNVLVGYVVYHPVSKRIQQFAVSKSHRQQGIASALFSELINRFGTTLSVINVDKSSGATNAFLKNLGLEVYLEQKEMELQLDATMVS